MHYPWQKLGVIPPLNSKIKSLYIPNCFLLNDDIIRIFVAFQDDTKIGRVHYIDVSSENPLQVINYSKHPVLDVGLPGTFDEHGVSPLSVIQENNKIFLYYAGWQLSNSVRYFIFTGLAISEDNGLSFKRKSNIPLLERTNEQYLIRSGSFVFKEDNKYYMIYAGGSGIVQRPNNQTAPNYNLYLLESYNLEEWKGSPKIILSPNLQKGEFGFCRPFIKKENSIYKMWTAVRHIEKGYQLRYFESLDLIDWQPQSEVLSSFFNMKTNYDTETSVPSFVETRNNTFMFYNGNSFGTDGICVAKMRSL